MFLLSSSYLHGAASHESRFSQGGWSAARNDIEQWISVDIEKMAIIQEIITRPKRSTNQWVEQYNIGMIDQ